MEGGVWLVRGFIGGNSTRYLSWSERGRGVWGLLEGVGEMETVMYI